MYFRAQSNKFEISQPEIREMDHLTRVIAEYATGLSFDELPVEVRTAATHRMVDSLACAVGAYHCEPANIARDLARGAAPEHLPGRILGFGERTTAESAAFVNTAMIRNLDFNDEYPGGHPSDCLGAFLGIAESAEVDGQRLLSALVVAYELFLTLNDATHLREKGWDQGFLIGICTSAGLGHLLRLPVGAVAEAIAITAVANVPMRNSRAGALSLWKGAATAFATRNAVFATLLASRGMTGPDRPFEGKHGLWDLITGPFELVALGGRGGRYRTPDVRLKYWPVEYNAQLVIWAALELREKVAWQDLDDVDIGTYTFAYNEIGSEAEKWDPRTRETADHSLPYLLARTLVEGDMNLAAFEESAFLDPSLRPLMKKIRVRIDPEVDRNYPGTVSMKIAAQTKDGKKINFQPRNPLGHVHNPMKGEDIRKKFLATTGPVLGVMQAHRALDCWWNLERIEDVGQALSLLDLEKKD